MLTLLQRIDRTLVQRSFTWRFGLCLSVVVLRRQIYINLSLWKRRLETLFCNESLVRWELLISFWSDSAYLLLVGHQLGESQRVERSTWWLELLRLAIFTEDISRILRRTCINWLRDWDNLVTTLADLSGHFCHLLELLISLFNGRKLSVVEECETTLSMFYLSPEKLVTDTSWWCWRNSSLICWNMWMDWYSLRWWSNLWISKIRRGLSLSSCCNTWVQERWISRTRLVSIVLHLTQSVSAKLTLSIDLDWLIFPRLENIRSDDFQFLFLCSLRW